MAVEASANVFTALSAVFGGIFSAITIFSLAFSSLSKVVGTKERFGLFSLKNMKIMLCVSGTDLSKRSPAGSEPEFFVVFLLE